MWIKSNKVPAILIVVLGFLAFGTPKYRPIPLTNSLNMYSKMGGAPTEQADFSISSDFIGRGRMPSPAYDSAPRMEVTNRKVVTNSYLSLLVKNVRAAIDSVSNQTQRLEGYVVNSSVSSPEGLSNGDITVRVPSKNMDKMLEYLRGSAVKVVTENISGTDITDQYMDAEERLKTLQTTKTKYEEILNSTTDVEQILIINDRIINIQDQIDNIKGQLRYMSETSQSTLITVYLSTDELELPFALEERWDTKLVFKYAVRSLVANARDLAGAVIWLAVYSVIWVPLLIIVWAAKKYWKNSPK
uniref:DUF4349 domain-containing protein n=1 Tax=candidate division WWE3 bacterium TaxID=2053526 RepID=A0A7C4XI39_UNCKA